MRIIHAEIGNQSTKMVKWSVGWLSDADKSLKPYFVKFNKLYLNKAKTFREIISSYIIL